MRDIKRGDLVKLKSGGPKMTVDSIGVHGWHDVNKTIVCTYFKNGKKNSNKFEIGSLKFHWHQRIRDFLGL